MQINRDYNILVVEKNRSLADMLGEAAGDIAKVHCVSSQTEALAKIRTIRPDIVIVVRQSESREELMKFYHELREGWISRHSSVLVIEADAAGDSFQILDDKYLETGITLHDGSEVVAVPKGLVLSTLKAAIQKTLENRKNKLKGVLTDPESFCLIWEQIPGLGAFEVRQETVIENAKKAAKGGKICAISVTDNPGGNPAIATEILAQEIRKYGVEPLVHVALRDRSRNQCESLLYQLAAMNINNLLVLTGDYPSNISFQGTSKPVFDLDSVNGLQLVLEMNRGMEHEIMLKKTTLAPTNFYSGVAFSPFKREEAEVMGQYYKLKKKLAAGAAFIITQVGYDVRKLHELQLWMRQYNYTNPVVVSIYTLSYATAKAMYDNHIPGCVVTEKLLAQVAHESESADKGRRAQLERSAKMYAIARGMGFAGASISGQGVKYENVEYIIGRGEELLGKWQDLVHEFDYPMEGGFYFYEKDTITALNTYKPAEKKQKPAARPIYYFSLAVHNSIFTLKSPIFKIMRSFIRFVDSSMGRRKAFAAFEFWNKAILYGCMNCGDCALFDVAYLCPVSQCPKNQRNGPCGGSRDGWCEIYPNEKKCIWVRAYLRLKKQHKEDTIGLHIIPPCNWELWQTSSWVNYFMGRDHVSKAAGIKPEIRK